MKILILNETDCIINFLDGNVEVNSLIKEDLLESKKSRLTIIFEE